MASFEEGADGNPLCHHSPDLPPASAAKANGGEPPVRVLLRGRARSQRCRGLLNAPSGPRLPHPASPPSGTALKMGGNQAQSSS